MLANERKTSGDMPRIGLEPTHLTAPEPKSGVSTNFTTWADDKAKNKALYPIREIIANKLDLR